MNARKYANVQYPTMYASEESAASDAKKKQFNCTQRAHQNTLESLSGILALTVYLGMSRRYSAYLQGRGVGWVLGVWRWVIICEGV